MYFNSILGAHLFIFSFLPLGVLLSQWPDLATIGWSISCGGTSIVGFPILSSLRLVLISFGWQVVYLWVSLLSGSTGSL